MNTPILISNESRALYLSAGVAVAVGMVAVMFSFLTNSQAILLDGVFNLAYFLTALVAITVARLITRPDDNAFPFGYGYFEALVNAIKDLLIMGVSILAFLDSAIAFATGGREIAAGPAVIYALLATLTCATVTLLLWKSHRHNRSPLVHANVQNWMLNTIISGTVPHRRHGKESAPRQPETNALTPAMGVFVKPVVYHFLFSLSVAGYPGR